MKRNAYQILGLEPAATPEEIKQRYDAAIAALNNAKGGPDPKLMAELLEAGAVLSNPQSRELYDRQLALQLIPSAEKTRRRKIKIIRIGSGVTVASLLIAVCWYAWDRGIIPGNPRAMNLATVEPLARRLSSTSLAFQPAMCASVELSISAPELKGALDVEQAVAPGLLILTLLKDPASGQQSRERQIKQLEFLTKQGYFNARDVALQTPLGEKPAREYKLTWEGYAQLQPGSGDSRLCFVGGQRVYVAATSIAKEGVQIGDLDVYDVAFTTNVINVPKWGGSEEAKELFPGYAESLKTPVTESRLVRGKDGWISANDVSTQMNLIQAGQGQMMAQYMQAAAAATPPSLDDATAQELVNTYLKSEEGLRRLESLCVPLNISGAGDDTEAAKRGVKYVITYQDKAERPPFSLKDLARRISILEAFAAAGLATRENGVGPMPVAGEPPIPAPSGKSAKSSVPATVQPAWVRYRIDPVAAEMFGMSRFGQGCLPLGAAKTKYLSFFRKRISNGEVAILKATFDAPPELSKRLAERIGAIRVALTEGVALTGSMQFQPPNPATEKADLASGKWKVSYLNPVMPQVRAAEFPAPWLTMMPLTAAILAKTPVPGMGNTYAPASSPALAPVPAAAPAAAPAPAPQKRSSAPPSTPAKSSVHVISIYEAEAGGGKIPQGRREGIVNIKVTSSDKPLWLVIDSYEPVHWIINAAPDSRLARVIASGYHPQRVSVSGVTGVTVEVSGDGPRFTAENSRDAAAMWVENKFGFAPQSVQVSRKATDFLVTPNPNAPVKS